ncbi:MAG TPA: SDR family oxidoreductase [Terriglobia bacterium]|nr:SDR family oxidoreductase [Terriglobia bacterium]
MTRTVLITGCSSGIGAATARLFAAKGWNVVATARRRAALEPLAHLPQVLTLSLDVQDEAGIATAIAAGIERFGKIDLLVNNAGFSLFGLFEGTSPAKIREQFDVNLFGVMAVTRAILPHFRRNKAGLIINVGSGAGIFTLPLMSMYCASKFALEGFTEALAYELASQNIGIKLIEPHGGVSSTAFGARVTEEVKAQAADSGIDAAALGLCRLRSLRRRHPCRLRRDACPAHDECRRRGRGDPGGGERRHQSPALSGRRRCARLRQGAAREDRPGLCRLHAGAIPAEGMKPVQSPDSFEGLSS